MRGVCQLHFALFPIISLQRSLPLRSIGAACRELPRGSSGWMFRPGMERMQSAPKRYLRSSSSVAMAADVSMGTAAQSVCGENMANGVPIGTDQRWTPPVPPSAACASQLRLRVHNSLCDDKVVDFVPASGARELSWYICGPTVYDSSHVGHARNYITFDVIRRILEDFFGYSVFYVMNVTDVDDKIIYRARRNYLLQKYAESATATKKVLEEMEHALRDEIDKQTKKVERVEANAAMAKTSRERDDLANALSQEKLKLRQLHGAEETLTNQKPSLLAMEVERAVPLLFAIAGDALAASLDSKLGATVTDLAIFRAHSMKYEREFFEDMAALGMRPPDVLCRVTESMPVIVNYVLKIMDNGFAYVSNGSVYFDTIAFTSAGHVYGKLCPWAVGQSTLAAESEANFETREKRNANDFALWKASSPGEPSWPSPWGRGRPGWHIECSAMASDIIGNVMDFHSGGCDLRFPHHDNELAQAEAYFGNSQWVNYFLHSGHLHIDGLKMSKSLKNFITVRKALKVWSARQLRFLFLLQPWDKPMNYSDAAMAEVQSKEKQFKNFFQNVQVQLRNGEDGSAAVLTSSSLRPAWAQPERELRSRLEKVQREVGERLADNFDTAGAIRALLEIVNGVNTYIMKVAGESSAAASASEKGHEGDGCLLPSAAGGGGGGGGGGDMCLLRSVATYVTRILSIFGLCDGRGGEKIGFGGGTAAAVGDPEKILGPYLDAFASFRDDVRAVAREGGGKEVILSLCDKVRDEALVDLGVKMEDQLGGSSVWKLDDPEVLKKEREKEKSERLQSVIKKLQAKIGLKRKELEKWERALPLSEFFHLEEKYKGGLCVFDGEGIPTHDATGKELSGRARKALEKEAKKVKELHLQLSQKMQEHPGYLEDLRSELRAMEDEVSRLQAP